MKEEVRLKNKAGIISRQCWRKLRLRSAAKLVRALVVWPGWGVSALKLFLFTMNSDVVVYSLLSISIKKNIASHQSTLVESILRKLSTSLADKFGIPYGKKLRPCILISTTLQYYLYDQLYAAR